MDEQAIKIIKDLGTLTAKRRRVHDEYERALFEYKQKLKQCDKEVERIKMDVERGCIIINDVCFEIVNTEGYDYDGCHDYYPGDLYCVYGNWFGRIDVNQLYVIATKERYQIKSIEFVKQS